MLLTAVSALTLSYKIHCLSDPSSVAKPCRDPAVVLGTSPGFTYLQTVNALQSHMGLVPPDTTRAHFLYKQLSPK